MPNTIKKTETCGSCGNDFTRRCKSNAYIGNNCFDCSFWIKKIDISEEDQARRVIVNGQHHRLGIDNVGPFRGFGGRAFRIQFQDGRIVETSNLWHQGEIPEKFREWLPDNATFIPANEIQVLPANDLMIPF